MIGDSKLPLSECLRVMVDVLINRPLFKKETTVPSFQEWHIYSVLFQTNDLFQINHIINRILIFIIIIKSIISPLIIINYTYNHLIIAFTGTLRPKISFGSSHPSFGSLKKQPNVFVPAGCV